MARRRTTDRNTSHRVEVGWPSVPVYRVRSALQLLEDRRLFHPLGEARPLRAFFMRPRLVVRNANIKERRNKFSVPSAIGFDVPKRVALCVRRKERREVIHAKNLTRKGSKGAKRRNVWSDIHC